MTTVHRIESPALEPFFRSLQATGFDGDVVVFASAVSAESVRQLETWGARVVPFRFHGKHVTNRAARLWWLWRRIFAGRLSVPAKERLAHAVFHLFYRRHLLYLEYLRAHEAQYEAVFLTDCRDVFFQADPFSWAAGPGLHVFLEEETNRIGQCPHNSRWIRSLFGEEALRKLSDQTVSCAGTVFGDVSAMKDYLGKMTAQAMEARTLRDADGDQGIHNYLIRTGRLDPVEIHPNRQGPVMTLGPMRWSDLRRNEDGWVVDAANRVVPTLHQYDRIPELREALLRSVAGAPDSLSAGSAWPGAELNPIDPKS
jgi:hypothetical protein